MPYPACYAVGHASRPCRQELIPVRDGLAGDEHFLFERSNQRQQRVLRRRRVQPAAAGRLAGGQACRPRPQKDYSSTRFKVVHFLMADVVHFPLANNRSRLSAALCRRALRDGGTSIGRFGKAVRFRAGQSARRDGLSVTGKPIIRSMERACQRWRRGRDCRVPALRDRCRTLRCGRCLAALGGRTPGALRLAGFQDRFFQPLRHPSTTNGDSIE